MVARAIAVTRLVDVASEVRFVISTAQTPVPLRTPGLGTVAALSGRFDRPEIFYSFTVAAVSPDRVSAFTWPAARARNREQKASRSIRPPYTTDRVFVTSKRTARACRCHHAQEGSEKDGTNPTLALRLRRSTSGFPDVPQRRCPRGSSAAAYGRRRTCAAADEYGGRGTRPRCSGRSRRLDDFIAAAEYLVKEKYASPQTLGIMGGSNGGCSSAPSKNSGRSVAVALARSAWNLMDMLRYHKSPAIRVGAPSTARPTIRRRSRTSTSTRRCTHQAGDCAIRDARDDGRS